MGEGQLSDLTESPYLLMMSVYIAYDVIIQLENIPLDGKLLMTIGTSAIISIPEWTSFQPPSKVALDPKTADLYISVGLW